MQQYLLYSSLSCVLWYQLTRVYLFHLSTSSLLPTNWFEVRLVITVFIEFFVRVGFKLFGNFVQLFGLTERFEVVVFDEKYTPQPFPKVGSLDVRTGVLTLDRNPSPQVIFCESREILPEGGETM